MMLFVIIVHYYYEHVMKCLVSQASKIDHLNVINLHSEMECISMDFIVDLPIGRRGLDFVDKPTKTTNFIVGYLY